MPQIAQLNFTFPPMHFIFPWYALLFPDVCVCAEIFSLDRNALTRRTFVDEIKLPDASEIIAIKNAIEIKQ